MMIIFSASASSFSRDGSEEHGKNGMFLTLSMRCCQMNFEVDELECECECDVCYVLLYILFKQR